MSEVFGQIRAIPIDRHDENDGDDFSYFSRLKNMAGNEEHHEGQLSVDVAETATELIVVAPMAGAPKGMIELHLRDDLLTVKGERHSPVPANAIQHFSECYWGKFSRSVVLPVDAHLNMAKAEYRNGLLVITLPKTKTDKHIPITIVEE